MDIALTTTTEYLVANFSTLVDGRCQLILHDNTYATPWVFDRTFPSQKEAHIWLKENEDSYIQRAKEVWHNIDAYAIEAFANFWYDK